MKVKRVIGGDTLLLTNGERVRLIDVDTPETKHPQEPIEYDWQRRNKYGRLLAYVYLMDKIFLNKEIIRQGYLPHWDQVYFVGIVREDHKWFVPRKLLNG